MSGVRWDSFAGGYYQDPNGMAGYDEWKLRSPYDGPAFEPDPCEHQDYEIDWEGEAACKSCGETWWPPAAEVEAYRKAERAADRAWRREQTWWMRRYRRIVAWLRRPKPLVVDDDIPF